MIYTELVEVSNPSYCLPRDKITILLESDVRIPRQYNCEVEDTRCVLNGVRPNFLTSKASLENGSTLVVDHSYSKKTAMVLCDLDFLRTTTSIEIGSTPVV